MIIRKSDLTELAISIGCWTSLKEMAGIKLRDHEDDVDIEITVCKPVK